MHFAFFWPLVELNMFSVHVAVCLLSKVTCRDLHLKARTISVPDTRSSRQRERESTGTLIWRDRVGTESSI